MNDRYSPFKPFSPLSTGRAERRAPASNQRLLEARRRLISHSPDHPLHDTIKRAVTDIDLELTLREMGRQARKAMEDLAAPFWPKEPL